MTDQKPVTATALPTGDELAAILDGYDDDLLAAYVRGLLHYFDLEASRLDPYQPETLADFADAMTQDLLVAAQGGNVAPLVHFAYRGVVDVAKDMWLEARERSSDSSDEDLVGDALLFALGTLNAPDDAESGEISPTPSHYGRLYGLLRRFGAWVGVVAPPLKSRIVRAPGCGVDYLESSNAVDDPAKSA